ncbi:S41 family peptidase [Singulisphaera sp. PoT]|uniref:S41 family peptidase n=1 Tax=Singulisphaera sp. PoT TaxID=3411797 RepID=UPI003BF4F3B4
MRSLISRRATWLFSLALTWSSLPVAWSSPPQDTSQPDAARPKATSVSDRDSALQKALELERKRNWSAAIHAYDEAIEQWPSFFEFSHRRRLCETHYKLARRYQDQSFRNVLLKLPRDKAMALYEELLERIQSHYVDPVAVEPLVRRGLDNMEVALRDPEFLRTNGITNASEQVERLRSDLRWRRQNLYIPDRTSAKTEVLAACNLSSQSVSLGSAAVILEFAFAACDMLDDYTSYLTPDKLDDLYAMIDGNFVGLGIELKLDKEGLRLVGVIRGGPAFESGLKIGDQITRVGGQSVKGLSLDEAAGKLQGTEGTTLALTILHNDGTKQEYRIVRRHVEVESVAQSKIIDSANKIGYIQLTGFQKNSTEEIDNAISELRKEGMQSLVLDLRGNPGGLLNVAVEIAERFIDKGIIVSTRGRAAGQTQVYRAQAKAYWTMPMTVLIDRDSASASEILAGALKDHNRATILGQRSYGKGSVQSIFTLRSAPAGLKLTTAKFYSPKNRPYSEQGVEPDITVRVDAKPPVEDEGVTTNSVASNEQIFGDPQHDQVLDQALLYAKRRLNAVR